MVSGKPVIVVQDGRLDQQTLRKLRFSIDDLMESLRQQGIFDLRDVQYAIVETTGKVSVLPKAAAQPVTSEMLGLKGEDRDPPVIAVSDGQIIGSALERCGVSREWLAGVLAEQGKTVNEVFLLTVEQGGKCCLIPRQRKGAPPPAGMECGGTV